MKDGRQSLRSGATSYASGCVRCPWYGVDAQDGVRAHVLLVARNLIWSLGRHHQSPSSVEKLQQDVTLMTHAQRRPIERLLPPFAVELCHRFPTFWCGCWLGGQLCLLRLWHMKVSSHRLGCNMVFAKCMQCARPGSTYALFVWNTGCEKACKKVSQVIWRA